MKPASKFLIVLSILLTACRDDDPAENLSPRGLLLTYDWITLTAIRGSEDEGEPQLIDVVWSFEEAGCSGSDFTGTFRPLGEWNVTEDALTMGTKQLPLFELNATKLVYEAPDGATVTRVPIRKVPK